MGEEVSDLKSAFTDTELSTFTSPISYSRITTSSMWVNGQGVKEETGSNFDNEKYCRSGYVPIEKPTILYIDSADYEFNCWCYSGDSISLTTYAPREKYGSDLVIISTKSSTIYFRIGVRRKDRANISATDITALTTAVKTFTLTDGTLTLAGVPADAKVTGDEILLIKDKQYNKEYIIEGYPFYRIKAPLVYKRPTYLKVNDEWALGTYLRNATAILPCPKYLMLHIKSAHTSLFLYVGDMIDGEFVVDETAEFYISGGGSINLLGTASGFMTYESDGTKYFWVASANDDLKDYDDRVDIIGCDEWPESPFTPTSWSYYASNSSESCVINSTDRAGYYLPEEAWIFVREVERAKIDYGIGSTASKPWEKYQDKVSAFYIPKNSGMPMLTVNQTDIVTKDNVCIIPHYLDTSISSNAIRAKELADTVLTKFRYTAKNNTTYIAFGENLTIGKEYHTIPYSGLWQPQHFVCFDTTPETAANAANDEYSVFYDNTSERSELSADSEYKRPGYGGVCSVFVSLACGSPYPQTTTGFFVDKNFVVSVLDDARPGDVVLSVIHTEEDDEGHGAFVAEKYLNGYSVYEYAPPGIIKSVHTSKNTVKKANYRVSVDYLKNYHTKIQAIDNTGWKTNYLNFDYEIANGSIRPWRGNKSVCSNYNKMTTPATSLSRHTGIHITVHDGATTAYIKKPSGTIVSLDVTGQTVVDIGLIVDEVGEYELYSNVSEVKEYFRYFEHDPVTIHIEEDGTVVFSSDDIDYAYVWCNSIPTIYPETGNCAPSVLAKGKKYPGITIRQVKGAVARDTTMVDGVEDSWGRYPVVCTIGN